MFEEKISAEKENHNNPSARRPEAAPCESTAPSEGGGLG